MAKKYAMKEKEKKNFETSEEAIRYIRTLAEKYFFHEVGHLVYENLEPEKKKKWEDYLSKHKKIREAVIRVQEDKYDNIERMRVSGEAFADFFIEVIREGVVSRLGSNKEAVNKIKDLLRK